MSETKFIPQVYDFGNKNKQMTYNFEAPLKTVVFNKGRAVVDHEETAAALDSLLEATSIGMYIKRDFDAAIDLAPEVTNKVPGLNQADSLITGIVNSGVATVNPAVAEIDSALAMALTQGVDATNELIASNPEVLGTDTIQPDPAPAGIKLPGKSK